MFSDTTDLGSFVIGALLHLGTTMGMRQDGGTHLQAVFKRF
jgi:hypothetical protein